jgi:hypothetical protein
MYAVRGFCKEVLGIWNKFLAIIFIIPPIGIVGGILAGIFSIIGLIYVLGSALFKDYFK